MACGAGMAPRCENVRGSLSVSSDPLPEPFAHMRYIARQALDNGARGIVMPHVDGTAEVREVVNRLKYPPVGHRSMGGIGPHRPAGTEPQRSVDLEAIEPIEVAIYRPAVETRLGRHLDLFPSALEVGRPTDDQSTRLWLTSDRTRGPMALVEADGWRQNSR